MSFYDTPEGAEIYIKMAEGYDGAELIKRLKNVLAEGASILELGMGPGIDLKLLAKRYKATGSDTSTYFVERFKKTNPDADVLILDAISLATDRNFDAIYSNKVLHHIDDTALATSFTNQFARLNSGGWIFHSFWAGHKTETIEGMNFHYRQPDSLTAILANNWQNVTTGIYEEFEPSDSFWILAQKP